MFLPSFTNRKVANSPGMPFRVFSAATASALILSACGSGITLQYSIALDVTDPAKVTNLIESSERVLLRRLASFQVENARVKAVPTGGSNGTLTVVVPNAEGEEAAKRILSEQFTFELRIEKEGASETDTAAENWTPTPLTVETLEWAQAIGNRQTGDITVDLQFKESAKPLLSKLFKDAKGKSVGIFVRGLLVSKLKVESTATTEHIIIGGIPSASVAEIFADDVNVGAHVTFTPLP